MSKKLFYNHLHTHISKYDFEINKYICPFFHSETTISNKFYSGSTSLTEHENFEINLEPFKNEETQIAPKICTWFFMSEQEVLQIKQIKCNKRLTELIEKKLSEMLNGMPKMLLIELLLSVLNFSSKNNYDTEQTGALLSIFYRTHQYFTLDLWMPPEQIYNFFKENVFTHCLFLPPRSITIFPTHSCKQIMQYFCFIYLRNLPLIRFLMLPNYGLLLKIKNPLTEEEIALMKKKSKKKTKKKKK